MMRTIVLMLFVWLPLLEADEKVIFHSLSDLRQKKGWEDYGASYEELFGFEKDHKLNYMRTVCYKTERGIDLNYAYSSKAVAGRKIIKLIYESHDLKLFRAVLEYDNYGDIFMGVHKPDYAVEFICGEDTFVLNYDMKNNVVSVSSSQMKLDMPMLAHSSIAVFISPKLQTLLNKKINTAERVKGDVRKVKRK